MYTDYWGLKKPPFDNVPDPSMYVDSHLSVENTVAETLFAIEEGNECLTVIVGDVGLGKTLSLRLILDSLDQSKYKIAFVTNPDMSFVQILREIIGQLTGKECEIRGRTELLEIFNKLLFETADEGRKVLVFIDEANAISPTNLESLRLLTNMQDDTRNLFTIVLAGQMELAKRLEHPKRANLFQRIGTYNRIEKMDSEELLRNYVDTRLRLAGADRTIFTDDAIHRLYQYSEGGVPRLVNKIAKLCLKAGETNTFTTINGDIVQQIGQRFVKMTGPAVQKRTLSEKPKKPREEAVSEKAAPKKKVAAGQEQAAAPPPPPPPPIQEKPAFAPPPPPPPPIQEKPAFAPPPPPEEEKPVAEEEPAAAEVSPEIEAAPPEVPAVEETAPETVQEEMPAEEGEFQEDIGVKEVLEPAVVIEPEEKPLRLVVSEAPEEEPVEAVPSEPEPVIAVMEAAPPEAAQEEPVVAAPPYEPPPPVEEEPAAAAPEPGEPPPPPMEEKPVVAPEPVQEEPVVAAPPYEPPAPVEEEPAAAPEPPPPPAEEKPVFAPSSSPEEQKPIFVPEPPAAAPAEEKPVFTPPAPPSAPPAAEPARLTMEVPPEPVPEPEPDVAFVAGCKIKVEIPTHIFEQTVNAGVDQKRKIAGVLAAQTLEKNPQLTASPTVDPVSVWSEILAVIMKRLEAA